MLVSWRGSLFMVVSVFSECVMKMWIWKSRRREGREPEVRAGERGGGEGR
jgi:hypothetical protein